MDLYDAIPKVELHCHVEGTVRASTVVDLARRNHRRLPTDDPTQLYRYDSLDSFLKIFWLVQELISDREDWARVAYESVVDAAPHGLRYREAFFTPALLVDHAEVAAAEDVVEVAPDEDLWRTLCPGWAFRYLPIPHSWHAANTTGDGFLATFGSAAGALRCALVMRDATRILGIELRVGVHTGEVEVLPNEIGGIAIHAAARIMAMGGASEIMVSSMTRGLVEGSDLRFKERGPQEVKGLQQPIEVFLLASLDRKGVGRRESCSARAQRDAPSGDVVAQRVVPFPLS